MIRRFLALVAALLMHFFAASHVMAAYEQRHQEGSWKELASEIGGYLLLGVLAFVLFVIFACIAGYGEHKVEIDQRLRHSFGRAKRLTGKLLTYVGMFILGLYVLCTERLGGRSRRHRKQSRR